MPVPDAADWVRRASHDPHLVAAVLLSFRRWSHLDLEAEGEDWPSTSAEPPLTGLLGWGRRIKRTPVMRIPRIVSATRKDEEEEEADATTTPVVVDRRKGKRRASPQSHLEGYSSTSASGTEEGTKAGRSAAFFAAAPEERHAKVQTVVAASPGPLKVSPISCNIRRPTSKKMTKLELQGAERTLLQDKANLLKEMQVWRKALQELRTENGKLKIYLTPPKTSVKFHTAAEDMQLPRICQYAAPSFPGQREFIALPDLNDPVADC